MAITNYSELAAAIQNWLDNNNTNVVAAIPDAIAMAESRLNRTLRTWEMECRTITPLVPGVPVEEELGYYGLPDDWGGHRSVVRGADNLLITYWARIQPLSQSVQTNWLISKYPDVYLYGSLAQLTGYAKDQVGADRWTGAFEAIIKEIESRDWNDSWGRSQMTIRQSPVNLLRYITPIEYDEMELGQGVICTPTADAGVFTVSAGAIRILPKPAMP